MRVAKPKRIFVVLGMHRSGTSAVARGLMALGIDLGDKLMPPAAGNNEKGFFEDVEAGALNDQVLQQLGRRWDSVWPVSAAELGRESLDTLRLRAVELLRERLSGRESYGLKDPRISVLLPLWQHVFAHLQLEESYIISSRHPLSVASSLRKRDGFDLEKSLYLWLEHVVACFVGTRGKQRVVVDFDRLMGEPQAQLARIAKALAIGRELKSADMDEYARDFLSEELRHSRFEANDLQFGDDVPRLVVEAYAVLRRLADDTQRIDDPEVERFFADAAAQLDAMRPALGYMARQDFRVEVLGAQKKDLEGAVQARADQIAALNNAAAVRDARVHELNLAAAAREEILQQLRHRLEEHEEKTRQSEDLARERQSAMRELHSGVGAELEAVRALGAAMRSVQFFGRQPAGLAELIAAGDRLAESLARMRKGLGDAAMGDALGQLLTIHAGTWSAFAAALPALFECTADVVRQAEIQRMRLLDSLRDVDAVEREKATLGLEVARLHAETERIQGEVERLRDEVERVRAEVRHRDDVLAQFPHQFVTRIGEMLDPYPAVRSVLTAPMRFVHWLLGHARA